MKLKNKLNILIFILAFGALSNFTLGHAGHADCITTDMSDEELYSYGVHDGEAYYARCVLPNADAKTIEPLTIEENTSQYGRDKNYLFYKRLILDGINPKDYRAKKMDYTYYDQLFHYIVIYNPEKSIFWLEGAPIKEKVDIANLKAFDKDYLMDKNNVYQVIEKEGIQNEMGADQSWIIIKKISGADPNYFEKGYKVTDEAVYWYGKRIKEVDPESFEVYEWSFQEITARDKDNVYHKGEILYTANPKGFNQKKIRDENNKIIESVFIDDKSVFFRENKYETIKELKEEFPQSAKKIDESIQSAITAYEKKYPGYEPNPAKPQAIFKDISVDHELYWSTREASNDGWINGYPDGNFKPDDSVNRAEFAKMLTLAFNRGGGNGRNLKAFPDVYTDQWYMPYLSKAVELEMMAGYPDGKMRPGNNINRAEALKMTLELIEKRASESELNPNDQWYEKYRLYAEKNFDLDFLGENQMGGNMSRGECVELILEAVKD